jgi:hypothetical protein
MNRVELEHIIRAAGAIADVDELIVIGSQAILGQFPNAPPELLSSREADVYPRYYPERSDLIESAIGYESQFERTFGYYADGVDESTAVLPGGWRDRLILVSNENTRFIKGWCLEVHDLAVSKYVAGREKDLDFCGALVRHGMVSRETLLQRLAATSLDSQLRTLVRARIDRDTGFRDFGDGTSVA